MTFPTTSATIARTDASNTFTGHQTIEGVTSTGATGTGKFVFDTSPTITGATLTTAVLNGTLGATTPSTIVATTTSTNSIKASGAEYLKVWSYTYTLTAGDVAAGFVSIAITAITQSKIRGISACLVTPVNGRAYGYVPVALTGYRIQDSTSFVWSFVTASVTAGDIVSCVIHEAV
jgi:hypothetical protein